MFHKSAVNNQYDYLVVTGRSSQHRQTKVILDMPLHNKSLLGYDVDAVFFDLVTNVVDVIVLELSFIRSIPNVLAP